MEERCLDDESWKGDASMMSNGIVSIWDISRMQRIIGCLHLLVMKGESCMCPLHYIYIYTYVCMYIYIYIYITHTAAWLSLTTATIAPYKAPWHDAPQLTATIAPYKALLHHAPQLTATITPYKAPWHHAPQLTLPRMAETHFPKGFNIHFEFACQAWGLFQQTMRCFGSVTALCCGDAQADGPRCVCRRTLLCVIVHMCIYEQCLCICMYMCMYNYVCVFICVYVYSCICLCVTK
jgi:hypothetical protein